MAFAGGFHQQQHNPVDCIDDKIIKLLATFEEIWNYVESKKDEMEIICQEHAKLLKPLPKWANPQKSEFKESEKALEEKGEQKFENDELNVPSENELIELSLIDKALEKAQKAWKKHQPTTAEDGHCCKDESKTELVSSSEEVASTTKVVSDDAKIGVISEKELTKALSNVRVSRIKSAYQKAPYKTFECERKKTSLSASQANKMQKMSSLQGSHQTKHSTLRNSAYSKNGKCHPSVKSLQAKSNISKDSRTFSNATYSSTNQSSGPCQDKSIQKDLKNTGIEKKQTKRDLKFDSNANLNGEPLYVIPESIKHLYQKNHCLKKKMVKMNDSSKSAESFVRLWETKMKRTPNDEAKLLSQKYENLYKLLQSLNLCHLSDSSTPQEILEARISMEYIHSSVNDLNTQTESLLKKVKIDSPPEIEPTLPVVPKEIWLPPHLLNSRFYHHLKESSPRLHYSSLKELNEYWDQQHKLQECLLSYHLLKVVFECLLPFLKSQHLQQRERIILYRILQGFLHHNGRLFPILIQS